MALDNDNKNAESGLMLNFEDGISNLNLDSVAGAGSLDGFPSFDGLGDELADLPETGAHDPLFSLDKPNIPQVKPSFDGAVDFPSLKGIGVPSSKSAPDDAFPSLKGIGVPSSKSAPDDAFPSLKGIGVPSSKSAPDDAFPSLKGFDLPSPKASASVGLPMPKGLDLPKPKSSAFAGLPSPKGFDLPTPKTASADGLPSPKGFDLPTPKTTSADGLPEPKTGDFKSLRMDDDPLGLNLDLSPASLNLDNALHSAKRDVESAPEFNTVIPANKVSVQRGVDEDVANITMLRGDERKSFASNNEAPRKPTMAFGTFSFDELNDHDRLEEEKKKRTSQEERAINNAMRGFEASLENNERLSERQSPKSSAQTTAQQLPNTGFAAPKIRLNNSGTQNADPLGLDFTLDPFDKNSDSGLPLNDDPLGVMGMARDASAESREQRSGLLRVDFQNDSSTPIPDAISMAQIDKSIAAEKLESQKQQIPQAPVAPTFDVLGLLSEDPNGDSCFGEVPPLVNNTPAKNANPVPLMAPPPQKGEVAEVGLQDEAIGEGEMVFDIASIKAAEAEKSIITSNEKERAEKAAKESAKRKRTSKIIIGCAIAFVIFAIAFAIVSWVIQQKNVGDQELAPVDETFVNEIRDDLLRADSVESYKQFYEGAIANLRVLTIANEDRLDNRGKAIVGMLFGSAYYAEELQDSIETINNNVPEIEKDGYCKAGWCSVGLWGWELINGSPEKAAEYEQAAQADPAFSNVVLIIKALAAKKKFESAAATYDEKMACVNEIKDALKNVSGWPIADAIYAEACMHSGAFNEAADRLAAYTQDANQKTTVAIQLLSAMNQFQLGNYSKALAQADELIKSSENDENTRKKANTIRFRAQAYSGDWNAFIKPIEDDLNAYRDDLQALSAIADICIQLGHAESCQILFKSLLDGGDTKDVLLYELYARVSIYAAGFENLYFDNVQPNQNLLESMARTLAEGIKLDSSRMSLWLYRAVVEFARKNYSDSMEAIVETERSSSVSWVLRVRSMIQKKIDGEDNVYDAINLNEWINEAFGATESYVLLTFLIHAGKNQEAFDFSKRMIALYPQDSRLRVAHFVAAVALQDRDAVEADIAELKKMHALTSEIQYKLARFLNDLGDPDAALKRMSQLVAQEPNNPMFLYYTGLLFFERGVYDSAKQYFDKTIKLDVSKPELYYYNGRCAYELGDYAFALSQFNEAHNKNDRNQSYNLWMANALVKINELEDALQMYTVVIDRYNNDADYKKSASDEQKHEMAVAYYERARIYQAKQKRSDASKDFLKAEAIEPTNMEFAKGYAIFLYESGDVKKVLEKIKLIESTPDSMDATRYYIKGLALLKLDKRSEALTAFELARDNGFADLEQTGINGLYDSAEIYERIGYMYRDAGRKKDAKAMLNLYLEKAKTLSERSKREIENELQRL